ncbi:MAG: GTP-binding protein [Chlorobi bacterium]|nr:GTP-binding protein [Chlorobiota bacterium]
MNSLINKNHKNKIYKLENILKKLSEPVRKAGNKDLHQTLVDLISRIHDPFMFVVVGEVKAGKSSFINALLDTGEEICKTAASPVTDVIQQILYGEKSEVIVINDYLIRRYEPVEILKDIAVVDTPGTNTVIKHHQEITERFIPVADLAVFVFEAKNPYRQSAWDFFDYIQKEWHKKIVFVLQQKDLLSEEDLRENINGLIKFAKQKGSENPLVFAVSAKDEIEGRHEQSNFSAFRDYIKTHVTGGKGSKLKIRNYINSSEKIIEILFKGTEERKKQLEQDKDFRKETNEILEKQYQKSIQKVEILVENSLAVYNSVTQNAYDELSSGLSIPALFKRSFTAFLGKKKSLKVWLQNLASEMEKELSSGLKNKLDIYIGDISDSVQQMVYLIDLKIRKSDISLKNNPDFFKSAAEKRLTVYRELKETFSNFISASENFSEDKLFPYRGNIAPKVTAGSGLAVIGVLLTAFTQGAVLDITGGVITGIGLIFAGTAAGLHRKKIMKNFKKEINKGKIKLEKELTEKLTAYINGIKEKINANFSEFDKLIESEEKFLNDFIEELSEIKKQLDDLK